MSVSPQQTRARQRATTLGAALLLPIALVMSVAASLVDRFPGDLPLAEGIQSLSTSWLDTTMEAVTYPSGTLPAVGTILVLAAVLAVARRRPEAVAFLTVLVLKGLLWVLKALIARPRPTEDLVRVLASGNGDSFPSGHTYHAVVFLGLVLVLLVVHIRPMWLRQVVSALLVALILLSGVSRVYLGIHWPSDVLGSVAFGIPSVVLLYHLCRRLTGTGAES